VACRASEDEGRAAGNVSFDFQGKGGGMMQPQRIGPIEAAQRAAYADCRRRLLTPPKPAALPPPPPKKVFRVLVGKDRPTWKRMPITFSAHVLAWQLHQAKQCQSPIPAYIRKRSKQLGFDRATIVGSSRDAKVVAARHLIMWEVWTKFEVSYPQLGKMFGGRDHSSCQHAVKKIAARRGQP
jgi:hypothetical protein